MTYKEAIERITYHMVVRKMSEPCAIKITESLNLAISVLRNADNMSYSDISTKELVSQLRVYVFVGHPGHAGDECCVPKALIQEASNRLDNNDTEL